MNKLIEKVVKMKREDFKLLVESWRKNLIVEMHDEDDDIYAPFDGEEDMSQVDMDEDLLDDSEMGDMDVEMAQPSDDREDMLRRFCDMMGIECEESKIQEFLAGQAFDAGSDMQGEDLSFDEEMH